MVGIGVGVSSSGGGRGKGCGGRRDQRGRCSAELGDWRGSRMGGSRYGSEVEKSARGVAASQSGVRRSCEARGGQVHRMTNGVSRRLRVAKAATAWSWEHGGSGAVMSPLVMPMGGSAVRAGGQSGAGVGVDELVDVLGRHQSFCSQCL